jgi:hemerythrin-like metal-binding protein
MVDKDHQKLFALINDVIGAMKKAEISGVVDAVRGLRGYTEYHFNREIELLQKCTTYPANELKEHKVKHASFVAKVTEFESKLGDQSLAAVCDLVSGDILTFRTDWLVTHIQNTDKRCTPYYKKHGFGSA